MFDTPMEFSDAVKHLLAKQLLPTTMTSADLQQVSAGIRRQSLFSAQTTLTDYLDTIRNVTQSVLQPQQEERPNRVTADNPKGLTSVGLNPATARETLRNGLIDLGYRPAPGEEGTIKDLGSPQRLNLVVKTNVQTAQGAGRFVQENSSADVVDLYPGLELLWREDDSEVPRGKKRTKEGLEDDPENGWPARWLAGAAAAGDGDAKRIFAETGRMVALKSSGIWQALGDGAGGHDDGLGNPYAPFAFNSTIVTEEMTRDECEEIGLLGKGEKAEPADFDFSSLFKAA